MNWLYQYCEGCNTYYVDTGCGQAEEHQRCPLACGLCGKPITGREYGLRCQGHTGDDMWVYLKQLREGAA